MKLIASQNDQFRREVLANLRHAEAASSQISGKAVLSPGVEALPDAIRDLAVFQTATFETFTADYDPNGEHDFGCFLLEDHIVYWQIQYLDRDGKCHSRPPTNISSRLMTIMLADEYWRLVEEQRQAYSASRQRLLRLRWVSASGRAACRWQSS